jgi:hypothetical protein
MHMTWKLHDSNVTGGLFIGIALTATIYGLAELRGASAIGRLVVIDGLALVGYWVARKQRSTDLTCSVKHFAAFFQNAQRRLRM